MYGFHPNAVQQPAATTTPRESVACKQDGCPCKDARILNYRTLRFIKAMAEARGQTASRVVTRPNGSWNTESEESAPA